MMLQIGNLSIDPKREWDYGSSRTFPEQILTNYSGPTEDYEKFVGFYTRETKLQLNGRPFWR